MSKIHFKRTVLFFLSVAIGAMTVQVASFGGEEWEKLSEGDGIAVYRHEIPGSDLIAFKGHGEIDANAVVVASTVLDYEHVTEWVDDIAEVKILEHKGPLEWVEYSHFKTPFVVKDRDFVISVHLTKDEKTGAISIERHSVEHPNAPQTSYVRGKVISSMVKLTPGANGKTLFEGEIQADPMGSIPKWLVNFIQKGWPRKTLMALRRQVKKPRALAFVHPGLLAFSESH